MKIKTILKNPELDFFTKSYFLLFLTPFIAMEIWIRIFYFLGKDYWEYRGEGAWLYSMWSLITGYWVYVLFLTLVPIFIILCNNKLMSGKKINKKTKFALFFLSLFFYILTLFTVSFVYSLF